MEQQELMTRMRQVRWIGRAHGVRLDDAVQILIAVHTDDSEMLDIYTRGAIANARMTGHVLNFANVKAWLEL